jgi:hypothetical protein
MICLIFEKIYTMKNTLVFILTMVSFGLFAQIDDKQAVQKAVETFFEGFHQQDSVLMKKMVADKMVLQTIAEDSEGKISVREVSFSKFLSSIVGIPEEIKFEEILKSFSIQIDGPMANAWTPYEFRLRDEFSHCGVNSFQLVKFDGVWKIVYLIDTRRKENCE